MPISQKKRTIDVPNGTTITYGVGADIVNNTLPKYCSHRVNVISGSVDVSYQEYDTGLVVAVEAAKTVATQNIYNLNNIARFVFTGNAESVVVVTSESID